MRSIKIDSLYRVYHLRSECVLCFESVTNYEWAPDSFITGRIIRHLVSRHDFLPRKEGFDNMMATRQRVVR